MRKSLIEWGPWWVPHWWHETQNIVMEWCECSNHKTDSKIPTQEDCVDCRGKTYSNPLWTSGGTTKRLSSMTERDKHTMRQWTMHSFERLKGVAWLMKVDHHGDQLNTQLTKMICKQVPCSKVMTNNCHYLQNDSLPISPIMVDEFLFSVLRVQRG